MQVIKTCNVSNTMSLMKSVLIIFLYASLVLSKPRKTRIIGGQEAFAGEFPYATAIYKNTVNGNYFCTGSLISTEWVLTAGQCVDGATLFTILVGTHKLSGDDASVQRLAADRYILHPDYNPLTLQNDIGVIKFRIPILLSIYIRPLYLPFADLTYGGGRSYGWGQVTDQDSSLSDTLNYVILAGVPDAECRQTYGDQIYENMVCFEGNYNQGTCFGDSGSPIVQDRRQDYTIVIAIASFFSGNGCESTDPSGYTNVYPYNDWINNVTRT